MSWPGANLVPGARPSCNVEGDTTSNPQHRPIEEVVNDILTQQDIAAWQPAAVGESGNPLNRARERMIRTRQWAPWQALGRRMAIGCVALEITQRCNLDCTFCYLSENSEALRDIPLDEVFRRIDLIVAHYGTGTDVQVTGGEPTLRNRDELIAIVERLVAKGLRPTLFTNGIKVTRALLEDLSRAGLVDVAFHVDLTQERAGFDSEQSLNAIRLQYMSLAHGLPLAVMFNTTLFPRNIAELPMLAAFFASQHTQVRLASFQIGADTGRGVGRPGDAIDIARVTSGIRSGIGGALTFDALSAGHRDCNRYAFGVAANGKVLDLCADHDFVTRVYAAIADVQFDRRSKLASAVAFARAVLSTPGLRAGVISRALKFARQHRADLVASRGNVGKISFFIHSFMDARSLDRERCDACSFMVMTPEGPISMCVHNAKRDDYLLQPARIETGQMIRFWNPVSGAVTADSPGRAVVALSRKNARGRARTHVEATAHAATAPAAEGVAS